jgi:hypothetical protein
MDLAGKRFIEAFSREGSKFTWKSPRQAPRRTNRDRWRG